MSVEADILRKYRVIAVIGLSSDPGRASCQVAAYMQKHGYRIVPVNPREKEVLGEKCYPDLSRRRRAVEIVDIFRRPRYVPRAVAEAIYVGAKVVWMQLGIVHEAAARQAREAGLEVVMDRCLKIEHRRLGAE